MIDLNEAHKAEQEKIEQGGDVNSTWTLVADKMPQDYEAVIICYQYKFSKQCDWSVGEGYPNENGWTIPTEEMAGTDSDEFNVAVWMKFPDIPKITFAFG